MSKNPDLPEDLINSILSKLPVKSLIQFKCACKSWYSLIRSPAFITMHLNSNKDDPQQEYLALPSVCDEGLISTTRISFLSYHDTMKTSSNLNLSLQLKDVTIIGSCNGLLCFSDELAGYIINPAIREFMVLKKPKEPCPYSTNCAYGFGYDPIKDHDYKLVRVTDEETEVLKLRESNSWTSKLNNTNVMEGIELRETWSKAVINNTIHWIGSRSLAARKGKEDYLIVAFDLVDEVFRDIIGIPRANQDCNIVGLHCSMVQDCLSIAICCYNIKSKYLEIQVCVMKEYGVEESWIKQYSFPMKFCLHRIRDFKMILESIGVQIDGEPLLDVDDSLTFMSITQGGGRLIIADHLKRLLQYGNFVLNYRESLVPVDSKERSSLISFG